MKNTFILFLFCFSSFFLRGQYRKMPLDTNHYWQQKWGRVGSFPTDFRDCSGAFRVRKDTIINGKVFKYVEIENGFCNQTGPFYSVGIVRDDTIRRIVTFMDGQQEKILYNFSKNVGDTVFMFSYSGMDTLKVIAKDSILLNDGLYHRRFSFSPYPLEAVIEGVGGIGGLFAFWTRNFEAYSQLLCLGQVSPPVSIYSSEGLGKSCPNMTGISSLTYNYPGFSIFPNPSNDFIKVSSESSTIKSIDIRNILGQPILFLPNINSQSAQIKIADLPTGMYIIRLYRDDSIVTRRFIKN